MRLKDPALTILRVLTVASFAGASGARAADTSVAGAAGKTDAWSKIEEETHGTLADLGLWVGGVTANFDHGVVSIQSFGAQHGGLSAPPLNASFEIGSISKSFTGILLALAVDETGITIDDQIGPFIPDINNGYVAALTFRQLATHSAGFPDNPDNLRTVSNYDPTNPLGTYNETALITFLSSAQPDLSLVDQSHPGHFLRSYSNVGFATLGLVLTRLYHASYDELVEDKITHPLRMKHTFVNRLNVGAPKHFLPPYGIGRNRVAHAPMDILAPAGAIVSTISDMLKFMAANIEPNHSPLGNAMRESQRLGFGWDSLPADGIIWKNGQTNGFASFMGFIPSAAVGVIMLSNMYNILGDYVGALPLTATNLFPTSSIYRTFSPDGFNQSTLAVPPQLLREAPGIYVNSDGQVQDDIKISVGVHDLVLASSGVPGAVALGSPVASGGLWIYDGVENAGTLVFDRAADSSIIGMTITTPKHMFRFTKQ